VWVDFFDKFSHIPQPLPHHLEVPEAPLASIVANRDARRIADFGALRGRKRQSRAGWPGRAFAHMFYMSNKVVDEDILYLDWARAFNVVTNLFAIVAMLLAAGPQTVAIALAVVATSALIIVISFTQHVGAIWCLVLPTVIIISYIVPAFYLTELPFFDALARLLFIYATYAMIMFIFSKMLP